MVKSHILTLQEPTHKGLAYIVPCFSGLRIGATKEPGRTKRNMVAVRETDILRKQVRGLYPDLKSATLRKDLVFKGTRDMRDPFCEFHGETNIIRVGGLGGAGTTASMGMAKRVQKLIFG